MRVYLCKNYEEMSDLAAKTVLSQVLLKPESVLGLATGSTPVGMYERLCRAAEAGEADFSRITTFNLDEYLGIEPENEQSYHSFMKKNFFTRAKIKAESIHMPSGSSEDALAECTAYDEAIAAAGGIDIQVLGIGQNGHIGFNEPGAELSSGTHIVELTESTIRANARFFENEALVPKKAITMGMRSIMLAKTVMLMASGKEKHEALSGLLSGKITTSNPSTMLNMHPNAIIICDEEAYNG